MYYVFRFGDNPEGMEIMGESKGWPIYGKKLDKSGWNEYEEKRARKILENCKKPEDIGNPSVEPPLGYDTWEEYWNMVMLNRQEYL